MLKTSVKILGVSCLALCLVFFTSLSVVAENPDNPGKGKEKLVWVYLTGDLSGSTVVKDSLLKKPPHCLPMTITMDGPFPTIGTYSGTLKLVKQVDVGNGKAKHYKELSFSHPDVTFTVYRGVSSIDRKTKVETIFFRDAPAVVNLETPDEMWVTGVNCVVVIAPQ